MNRPDPANHHCSRCGEDGDARTCNCLRTVSRRLSESRRRLNLGEPIFAKAELKEAERLLELLALDAQKARRDRQPPRRERHHA